MTTAPKPAADTPSPALLLSALIDGEAAPAERDAACAAWRAQPQARADWHAYAVIGDVLRSDELGRAADADAAFVHGLRRRLAAEPTPLAPSALERLRRRLAVPVAVAAGFVAVAGTTWMLRSVGETAAAGAMAAGAASQPVAMAGLRDRSTDRYVDAHRQSIRRASLVEAGGGR